MAALLSDYIRRFEAMLPHYQTMRDVADWDSTNIDLVIAALDDLRQIQKDIDDVTDDRIKQTLRSMSESRLTKLAPIVERLEAMIAVDQKNLAKMMTRKRISKKKKL